MPSDRTKPDHDVAGVVARLKAWHESKEAHPMFPGSDPPPPKDERPTDPPKPKPKSLAIAPGDVRAFVKVVGEMRRLQARYFRTRSSADLADAKAHEAAVDRWMREDSAQGRLDLR
jgi:hypothetical protein